MITILTERLNLRPFTADDLNELYALNSDPEVMKYISGGIPDTKEEVKASLDRVLSDYEKIKNYGLLAAEQDETEEFIGWFALKPLPNDLGVEIGYRLKKEFWGKGLATEGSSALLEFAFQKLKLPEVVGITHPEHGASKRVLEKLGLSYQKDIPNPYIEKEGTIERVNFYSMKNPSKKLM